MCPVLILDYPVVRYGMRMFVTDFFPKSQILHAYSLDDAKKHISDGQVCLVIMDIDISGHDMKTIKMLRSLKKDIGILIFTELENEKYKEVYMNSGVSGFICENSTQEDYKKVIEQVIEKNSCFAEGDKPS